MTYATLLVHLQAGGSNTALLAVAAQFADRFGAHLVGVAACQPMMIVSADGTVCGDVFDDDQRRITVDLAAAETEFRDTFRGTQASLEWRSMITVAPPADYLAMQSRSADLIMTGRMPADTFNFSRAANAGTLVMEAGRPLFIVPPDTRPMMFRQAFIGWKDTRECRRAVADALPLLKQTGHVLVCEIAAVDEVDGAAARVADVVSWLKHHGVVAQAQIEPSKGTDAEQLRAASAACQAEYLVAGAYGNSRLREWVTGGVTRDLLLGGTQGVLMSH